MRIQDLAIVFLIIVLPISIVLATYTQYQIQTINTQTLYDNKLSSATYDAIRAFQINTSENKQSDLANSKIRDLEASVSTFRNSIMSTFSLDGYSQDDLNSYIPALVYTLYDGFYIYSPYKNINYRYRDAEGTVTQDTNRDVDTVPENERVDDNGENLYGLKPYISYSCRYKKDDSQIDVVITYALDNHITVQGMIKGEYVNKDGYLIDNINLNNDKVIYNGIEIKKEETKEYLPLSGENDATNIYSYIKLNNVKYYAYSNNTDYKILARLNQNVLTEQYTGEEVTNIDFFIRNENSLAQDYYKDAYYFTEWFKASGLEALRYSDAYDSVVDENGEVNAEQQVWGNNNTLIFDFNTSTNYSENIENELSNFNQHRLAVIRHKIEVNLAIAIANYNNYSGTSTSNVFQMPELKEDEWDNITHNISLISFLQGLPIGGKIYNGYSIVTNSESEEVVLEQNIYILGQDQNRKTEYYRIGDQRLKNGAVTISTGNYGTPNSAGRLNLDFKRDIITNSDISKTYYFYPLKDYNASYNSIIMQNNVDTYDDIYAYVNDSGNDALKVAFYTALGRERASKYRTWEDYETYTITYNAGRGYWPPSLSNTNEITKTVRKGDKYFIGSEEPIVNNGTFLCWITEDGVKYGRGEEYRGKKEGNIILYAVYKMTGH